MLANNNRHVNKHLSRRKLIQSVSRCQSAEGGTRIQLEGEENKLEVRQSRQLRLKRHREYKKAFGI